MTGGPAVKAVRLFIAGRVQGVWFRGWAVDTARKLGVRGWVRNRRDGRVEVLVCGGGAAIDAMIAACREGPPAAHVAHVEQSAAGASAAGASFEQRPTH